MRGKVGVQTVFRKTMKSVCSTVPISELKLNHILLTILRTLVHYYVHILKLKALRSDDG